MFAYAYIDIFVLTPVPRHASAGAHAQGGSAHAQTCAKIIKHTQGKVNQAKKSGAAAPRLLLAAVAWSSVVGGLASSWGAPGVKSGRHAQAGRWA